MAFSDRHYIEDKDIDNLWDCKLQLSSGHGSLQKGNVLFAHSSAGV